MFTRRFLHVFLACALPVTGMAADVRFTGVNEDGSLQMANGQKMWLAHIVMPDPSSRNYVQQEIIGQSFRLGVIDTDRYGIPIANLYDATGSLQDRLVRERQVLAYTAHLAPGGCELLRHPVNPEWEIDYSGSGNSLGQYRLVSGTIQEVNIRKQMTYLNFGSDWKTDFTVSIPNPTVKLMDKERLAALKGKRIRVRGYIHEYDGPRIMLFEPAMMEVDGETGTECHDSLHKRNIRGRG